MNKIIYLLMFLENYQYSYKNINSTKNDVKLRKNKAIA